MRMHLCGNEYLVVSVDARTGKFTLRDTGDLASAGRKPALVILSERVNQFPHELLDRLVNLRYTVSVIVLATKCPFWLKKTMFRRSSSLQNRKPNTSDCRPIAIAILASKVCRDHCQLRAIFTVCP